MQGYQTAYFNNNKERKKSSMMTSSEIKQMNNQFSIHRNDSKQFAANYPGRPTSEDSHDLDSDNGDSYRGRLAHSP